jgi:hypothetical protein
MENIPNKIYLQIGDDFEPDNFTGDFKELSEISWCVDKIYDGDIEYINRSSIKKKLEGKIESMEKSGLLRSVDEAVIIGIKMAYSLI